MVGRVGKRSLLTPNPTPLPLPSPYPPSPLATESLVKVGRLRRDIIETTTASNEPAIVDEGHVPEGKKEREESSDDGWWVRWLVWCGWWWVC